MLLTGSQRKLRRGNKVPIAVKICGLSTSESVAAAIAGGAAMVGFVFFPPSPRAITPDRLGGLVAGVPASVPRVGLFVDATDDEIESVVATGGLDILQLHGGESPQEISRLKSRFGLPVMKAVAISEEADLDVARTYEPVVDRLLFDARPPKGATRPGGNALAFDWQLIKGASWAVPWLLAGGLKLENMAEAVAASGATALDVSSGVEDAPGIKSVEKISEFLKQAARL